MSTNTPMQIYPLSPAAWKEKSVLKQSVVFWSPLHVSYGACCVNVADQRWKHADGMTLPLNLLFLLAFNHFYMILFFTISYWMTSNVTLHNLRAFPPGHALFYSWKSLTWVHTFWVYVVETKDDTSHPASALFTSPLVQTSHVEAHHNCGKRWMDGGFAALWRYCFCLFFF